MKKVDSTYFRKQVFDTLPKRSMRLQTGGDKLIIYYFPAESIIFQLWVYPARRHVPSVTHLSEMHKSEPKAAAACISFSKPGIWAEAHLISTFLHFNLQMSRCG